MKTSDSVVEKQQQWSGSGKRKFAMSAAPLNKAREKRVAITRRPVGLKKSTAEQRKTFRNCSIPANVSEELLE